MGNEDCYPVAFGVPALLMFTSLCIFILGSKLYKHRRSANTSSIVSLSQESEISRLIPIFLPIMAFWALYDQQGSRWTYQAMLMDPRVFGLVLKPEQMQVINAILILLLIPLFDRIIYPALSNVLKRPLRPLQRMTIGMALGVISFLIAAALQWRIETGSRFLPNPHDPITLICIDGCVPILWQSIQYLLITSAEIMVAITGLEFAYSQAPTHLKSVCQSLWLLMVAGGNLLVILLNELDPIRLLPRYNPHHHMTLNFIMWAIILTIATWIFHRKAHDYVYVEEMHTIPLDE